MSPLLSTFQKAQLRAEVRDVTARAVHERATELIHFLDLGERAKNLPDALSGGQRQRVTVVRAWASHPDLTFADLRITPTALSRMEPGLLG